MNVNPFSYLIEKLKGKVNKSGDTMTGKLTIDASNSTPLAINGTNNAGTCYLGFGNSNGTRGYFAVGNDKLPYFEPAGGSDVRIALLSDITPASWDTYTVGTRDLYVRKIGGMVEMYFWTDETLTATTTICTLADKYKPSLPTYPNLFVVHDYLANDDLEIYKDGKIKTVSSPKSGWKVFHATWGV